MSDFDWEKEFKEFYQSSGEEVPQSLSEGLKSKVHRQLHPSTMIVFSAMAGVHLFAGSLTLLVCPQFGMGPFTGWFDLMQVVMPLGGVACAIFCGALYMGATATAIHMVFSVEMLRALEATRFKQFSVLGALSMAGFMLLTSWENFHFSAMSFNFFWLVGGVLLSQGIFHLLFRLRGLGSPKPSAGF